jgi:hypothetical protein
MVFGRLRALHGVSFSPVSTCGGEEDNGIMNPKILSNQVEYAFLASFPPSLDASCPRGHRVFAATVASSELSLPRFLLAVVYLHVTPLELTTPLETLGDGSGTLQPRAVHGGRRWCGLRGQGKEGGAGQSLPSEARPRRRGTASLGTQPLATGKMEGYKNVNCVD